MKKIAIITGIAGQDGSYLAELLLSKGFDVHGIVIPESVTQQNVVYPNLIALKSNIFIHQIHLTDFQALVTLLTTLKPSECYHLAASTFVSYKFDDEFSLLKNNNESTHSLLAALKTATPKCKFFQASSAEIFGAVAVSPQTEETLKNPRSIYGMSKLFCQNLVQYYRTQHGMFCCSGILYNHESVRRGPHFVTRKITQAAANIKLGKQSDLILGNLAAVRDWGYAPEYVEAMWLMLQSDSPQDYVIASGKGNTVEEFVRLSFESLGLNWKDYVRVSEEFFRPLEAVPLVGNPAKIAENLGWKAKKPLSEIVEEMVKFDFWGGEPFS